MGHRAYVGGMWDEIGALQFNFLVSKGLKPNSNLLDIACGSLRLGVKVIPFLEPGHYFGIEKERGLVVAGLEQELDPITREAKRPNIVISNAFEFEKFERRFDFAIAQSLFTHLPPHDIDLCFKNLRPWLTDNGVFFATYVLAKKPVKNPEKSHDHRRFAYTESEMISFGNRADYSSTYIGDWNHPRKQVIVEYKKN